MITELSGKNNLVWLDLEAYQKLGETDRLGALLNWSSQLTAESSPEDAPYLYPDSIILLRERLKACEGALVGVVGLRGVGKSSAALHLSMDLDDVIAVKWGEDMTQREEFIIAFKDVRAERIRDLSRASLPFRRKIKKFFGSPDFQDLSDDNDPLHERRDARKIASMLLDGEKLEAGDIEDVLDYLEDLLPRHDLKDLEREALDQMLIKTRTILITMPDYPSRDPRAIARDIDDIQKIWGKALQLGENPNIVLFLQAETFSTQDHFFFGKLLIYRIDPFRPERLRDYYVSIFGSPWPFQDETLRYVSKISRGIFRRFKRFIGILLEIWQIADRSKLIDGEFVARHLSSEKIFAEMDLELSNIFRHEATKDLAIKLIQTIIGGKDQSQKELARVLEVSEGTLSKMISRLEDYGYVRRERRKLPEGGEETAIHSAI